MAKKSFFSRLMGSDIADEGQEEHISNFSFELEEEEPMEENVEPRQYGPQPAVTEQEWLPESNYEGQLSVDVYQTKDDVIIQTIAAGVTAEDIDITIANDKVTIEGERKRNADIPVEDYFYQEVYWGAFSRSVVLPVDVDMDSVEAKMKDGILTVVLPKAAKAKVKKIQVKKGGE